MDFGDLGARYEDVLRDFNVYDRQRYVFIVKYGIHNGTWLQCRNQLNQNCEFVTSVQKVNTHCSAKRQTALLRCCFENAMIHASVLFILLILLRQQGVIYVLL